VRGRIKPATLAVADRVQGKQHFGRELAAFLEDGVDGVGIDLGMRRHGLELVADIEQFMQHEMHVAQGGVVLTHRILLCSRGVGDREERPFQTNVLILTQFARRE
jgi:hypothetical protein